MGAEQNEYSDTNPKTSIIEPYAKSGGKGSTTIEEECLKYSYVSLKTLPRAFNYNSIVTISSANVVPRIIIFKANVNAKIRLRYKQEY